MKNIYTAFVNKSEVKYPIYFVEVLKGTNSISYNSIRIDYMAKIAVMYNDYKCYYATDNKADAIDMAWIKYKKFGSNKIEDNNITLLEINEDTTYKFIEWHKYLPMK